MIQGRNAAAAHFGKAVAAIRPLRLFRGEAFKISNLRFEI